MANRMHFSTALCYTAFVSVFAFVAASCSNTQKNPEDTKDMAEEKNDAKFDSRAKEWDAQFLVNAAEINLEEIELGKLAQQSGTAEDVKALGKMMEDAHTKAMNDLKTLAEKKQVSIPTTLTEDGMDAYKKISGKSGRDFDKAYCDMMVDGHEKAISKFEKASADAEDTDIRTWATSMLPELRSHLDHSLECKRKQDEKR